MHGDPPAVLPTTLSSELSAREREILNAVYEGRSSQEIADAAGIAESTVQWHIANTRRKLRATSSAEAVVKAFRRGLLDEPPHPSALKELRHMRAVRAPQGRATVVAETVVRWLIAAVLVIVTLIGISGAATSLPFFRFAPQTIPPTLVPPATTSPRP